MSQIVNLQNTAIEILEKTSRGKSIFNLYLSICWVNSRNDGVKVDISRNLHIKNGRILKVLDAEETIPDLATVIPQRTSCIS